MTRSNRWLLLLIQHRPTLLLLLWHCHLLLRLVNKQRAKPHDHIRRHAGGVNTKIFPSLLILRKHVRHELKHIRGLHLRVIDFRELLDHGEAVEAGGEDGLTNRRRRFIRRLDVNRSRRRLVGLVRWRLHALQLLRDDIGIRHVKVKPVLVCGRKLRSIRQRLHRRRLVQVRAELDILFEQRLETADVDVLFEEDFGVKAGPEYERLANLVRRFLGLSDSECVGLTHHAAEEEDGAGSVAVVVAEVEALAAEDVGAAANLGESIVVLELSDDVQFFDPAGEGY